MAEIPLHLNPVAVAPHSEVNPAARKKLHEAANEFESMLLTSLWKSYKDSSLGDSDSDDSTGQTYKDFALQAMSSAIASNGGFGIGRIIEQDLSPKINSHSGGSTPLPPFSPLD